MDFAKKTYTPAKLTQLGDFSNMTLGNLGSRNDGPGSPGFNKGKSSVDPDEQGNGGNNGVI